MRAQSIISTYVAVILMTVALPAFSSAYKCTDSQGKITFSDTPCPTSSASATKIMERGAGYNPLTEQEKVDFKRGFMSRCTQPRNVCECMSAHMVETLAYEELVQLGQARRYAEVPGIVQKIQKIERTCQAREAQR